MTLQWTAVCIDCRDGRELAEFYAQLFGWEITAGDREWFQLGDRAGGVHLNIQGDPRYQPPTWPEQGDLQQKMIHLDVRVTPSPGQSPDEALAAALDVAVVAGGTPADHQPRDDLRVVLDPAGHPLCLFLD